MIGGLLRRKKLDNPSILPLCPQEGFVNFPINLQYFSTISTRNRDFRPSIMAQTTSAKTFTFGDDNTAYGNINNSFSTTIYNSEEDAKIMHWLSPLEPGDRHHGVRADRFGGIGDWFLEESEFREWWGVKEERIRLSCLLRESRGGQDISEVNGEIL